MTEHATRVPREGPRSLDVMLRRFGQSLGCVSSLFVAKGTFKARGGPRRPGNVSIMCPSMPREIAHVFRNKRRLGREKAREFPRIPGKWSENV